MKRLLITSLLALSVLMSGMAYAAQPMTLRMALGDPEDSEMGVVGNTFKKYVEEKSAALFRGRARR